MSKPCDVIYSGEELDEINKKKLHDLYAEINSIKNSSKNPKEFAAKSRSFLKDYTYATKLEEHAKTTQILFDDSNADSMTSREKAFTSKDGYKDFVTNVRSYFANTGVVAEGVNSHNVEVNFNIDRTKLFKIVDAHLEGKTVKDKILMKHELLSALENNTFDKEIFDYIESGGKAQVHDFAKALGEFFGDFNKATLEMKQNAGFVQNEIANRVVSQSRYYNAEHIRGNEASFVEDMMQQVDTVKTLGDDAAPEQMQEFFQNMALKIVDKNDSMMGGSFLSRTFEESFQTAFKKRHGKGRTITFKPGGAYEIYKKYGDANLLESVFKDAQSTARDTAFAKVFGPLALEADGGIASIKKEAVKRIRKEMKEKPQFAEKYQKQLEDIKSGNFGSGITEKSLIANLTGEIGRAVDTKMAFTGDFIRTGVATQILGGAALPSIADFPNMFEKVSQISGQNIFQSTHDVMGELFSKMTPEKQNILDKLIFAHESVISNESRLNGQVNYIGQTMGSISKWQQHLSLLPHLTRHQRSTLAIVTSGHIHDAMAKGIDNGDPIQKALFSKFQITPQMGDLAVKYASSLADGQSYTTPHLFDLMPDELTKKIDGINHNLFNTPEKVKTELQNRFEAMQYELVNKGVSTPDLLTRSFVNQGARKGSLHYEVAETAAMLKKISWQVFKNSIENYKLHQQAGVMNGAARSSIYFGSMLVGGYVVQSLQNLRDGTTPPDPTSANTFKMAFVKGGAGGIMADTVLAQNPQGGGAALRDTILGPAFGKLFEYGGGVIDSFATEKSGGRDLKFSEKKKGITGFFNALSSGDQRKIEKDLLYAFRQVPGNNLLPIDIVLKNTLYDTIRGNNPKQKANERQKMKDFSGALWNQEKIFN